MTLKFAPCFSGGHLPKADDRVCTAGSYETAVWRESQTISRRCNGLLMVFQLPDHFSSGQIPYSNKTTSLISQQFAVGRKSREKRFDISTQGGAGTSFDVPKSY